jgi:hypothetical protein
MDEKDKDFVKFHAKRRIVNLYKNFLVILEDLQQDGQNLSDERYQRVRKKILDAGNDAYREIEEILDKTEIRLK